MGAAMGALGGAMGGAGGGAGAGGAWGSILGMMGKGKGGGGSKLNLDSTSLLNQYMAEPLTYRDLLGRQLYGGHSGMAIAMPQIKFPEKEGEEATQEPVPRATGPISLNIPSTGYSGRGYTEDLLYGYGPQYFYGAPENYGYGDLLYQGSPPSLYSAYNPMEYYSSPSPTLEDYGSWLGMLGGGY